MGHVAEELLRVHSELPAGHRQYLITAGVTGYIAAGQKEKARALWNRYPNDVRDSGNSSTNDLTLRLVRAHAFSAAHQ